MMETVLVPVMSAGTLVLVGGSIALVGLAFTSPGPRRSHRARLAFRAIGIALGLIWVAYGLLLLSHPSVPLGILLAVILFLAGGIGIWVSLRKSRPLG